MHPGGGLSPHTPKGGRGPASFGAGPGGGGGRAREGETSATKERRSQPKARRERKGGVLAAGAAGAAAVVGPRFRRAEHQVLDNTKCPTGLWVGRYVEVTLLSSFQL